MSRMYTWARQDDNFEKRIPAILSSNDYYMDDTERETFIEKYNDPNPRIRRRWRRALDTDVTNKVKKHMKDSITHDGNVLIAVDGIRRSGKSTASLTILIWLYFLLLDFCNIEGRMDWRRTYTGVNKSIEDAEKGKYVLLSLRDEDPGLSGPRTEIERDKFINTLKQAGILKHCFVMCDVKPVTESMLDIIDLRIRIIARSEEYQTNLAVVFNRENRPIGHMFITKDLTMQWLYDEYREWKLEGQHESSSHGGAEMAGSEDQYSEFTDTIFRIAIAKFPNVRKLTFDMFLEAHTASGIGLSTGDDRKEVWGRVKRKFTEYRREREPDRSEPINLNKSTSRPKGTRGAKSERYAKPEDRVKASEIKCLADQFEVDLRDKYGANLFGKYITLSITADNKRINSQPDAVGWNPSLALRNCLNIEEDGAKYVIAAKAGSCPKGEKYDQISIPIREEAGGQVCIERELIFSRTCKGQGENVRLIILFKEHTRNRIYPTLVDIDAPVTFPIHFEKDPYLDIESLAK